MAKSKMLQTAELGASTSKKLPHPRYLEAFRWMLEELKVSLFAQELKTPVPVSFKRLEKAWQELSRS